MTDKSEERPRKGNRSRGQTTRDISSKTFSRFFLTFLFLFISISFSETEARLRQHLWRFRNDFQPFTHKSSIPIASERAGGLWGLAYCFAFSGGLAKIRTFSLPPSGLKGAAFRLITLHTHGVHRYCASGTGWWRLQVNGTNCTNQEVA